MSLCPYDIYAKTLILGAGGGFDIYACLPWYLQLTKQQKDLCLLANYSFTDDLYKYETYSNEWIVEINEDTESTTKNVDYFPEKYLAKSLNKSIYAVRLIPNPLLEAELNKFVSKHQIKQIILVDGGVDSCLYGDELSIGSPLEDSQTIIACYRVSQHYQLPCKLMCCALHVDEVSVETFIKHWNAMVKQGSDCHKIKLNKEIFPFDIYKEIVQAPKYASIIHESILASIEGHRGKYQNPRLFPERIDDQKYMPILHDDTACLWWLDIAEYVLYSLFYQQLILCEPMSECRNMDESCIHKLWSLWNETIRNFWRSKNIHQ